MPITKDQVQFTAIRAQGPGGQNVNKVSTAIQLRFDIAASSLAPEVQARLRDLCANRVSKAGVLVIKAQSTRSQEHNRVQALARLNEWVKQAEHVDLERRPTKPTRGSRVRRLESKAQRGAVKASRRKGGVRDEGC
jgi:ribosome-associated protein